MSEESVGTKKYELKDGTEILFREDDACFEMTHNDDTGHRNVFRLQQTDKGIIADVQSFKGTPWESGSCGALFSPLIMRFWLDEAWEWVYRRLTDSGFAQVEKIVDPIDITKYIDEDVWSVSIMYVSYDLPYRDPTQMRQPWLETDRFGNRHYRFDYKDGCVRVTNMSTGSTRLYPRERIVRIYATSWESRTLQPLPPNRRLPKAAKRVWKDLLEGWGLTKEQAGEAFKHMYIALHQNNIVLPKNYPMNPWNTLIEFCKVLARYTKVEEAPHGRYIWSLFHEAFSYANAGHSLEGTPLDKEEPEDITMLSKKEIKRRLDTVVGRMEAIDGAVAVLKKARESLSEYAKPLMDRHITMDDDGVQ